MQSNRITNGSGAAICALAITANAYSVMSGTSAGQGAWITHIIAGAAATLLAWCLAEACDSFQGKNFYETVAFSCGKWASRIFAAAMALFSLVTCVLSLTLFTRFVQITALPRTPQIILPLLVAFIAAMSLRCGLRAVSGAARLLFWFAAAVFCVFVLFGIKWMDFSRILPVGTSLPTILTGAGEVFLNRFGTVFALMAVYTRMDLGQGRKKFFLSSVAGASAALTVISLITVATLGGETAGTDFYPVFTAMSVRGVGGFIQHTEILACIVMTLSLFFKTAVCVLFAEDMLCGIFDVSRREGAGLPLAFICAAMTQLIYRDLSSLRGMVEWKPGAGWAVAVYVVFPAIFLAAAKRKNESK